MFCKRALAILLALAALLLPAAQAAAEPPPSPPCRFYGTVLLDGEPVPDGTLITITIEGDTYTTTTPGLVDGLPVYGNSTFAVTVVPLPGTSYSEQTAVIFKVAGYEAGQLAYWETGGNVKVDLFAWVPPATPMPEPSPTPTPTPTPTASPSPTPTPTAAPSPSTPGTGTGGNTNAANTVVVALCIGVLIVCAMFAAYLIWKYRIRPGQARRGRPRSRAPKGAPPTEAKPESEWIGGEKTMSTEPQGDQASTGTADPASIEALLAAGVPGLRWQDRMMLKMMSNKVVIKIFSNPIVMKVITWEMKAIIAISSLFKRKPAEGK